MTHSAKLMVYLHRSNSLLELPSIRKIRCLYATQPLGKSVNLDTLGLLQYLEALYLLDVSFGVHLSGEKKAYFSIDEAIEQITQVVSTLNGMVEDVHAFLPSTRLTKGPDRPLPLRQ